MYNIIFVAVAIASLGAATGCGIAQTAQTSSPEPEVAVSASPEPEAVGGEASEPEAVAGASSEPKAVVSALIEAMETNDGERIRSLFDDNASQAYGDGSPRSGEAFFRWLDSDIIDREGRVENAQLAVDGNEVFVTGQYQSRGYTSAANFLLTVENGRIVSWRMRY